MANEIQTAPSTTLDDNVHWQSELNLRELSMKGYDGISLTEWAAGDTDRPQIAAGSVIEIDGAIAKFTNQTAITDEGGIADGWCYIKFVVSGSDVTPTLTNTFGTWDTVKQGFYDGSGNRYSLFAMYRSGAITKIFTEKDEIDYKTAKLGYRFYEKYYSGKIAYDGALYIFTFTDTFFLFAEYYGNMGVMAAKNSTFHTDNAGFCATENVGGKLGFCAIYDSSYNGKAAKIGIRYKLTL